QEEICQWLEARLRTNAPTSLGELQKKYQTAPYGWKEIDIAALVAKLLVQHQIELKYAGKKLLPKEIKPQQLRNTKEIDKILVSRRIAASEDLKRRAARILHDYLNCQNIPEQEQDLVEFIIKHLQDKKQYFIELLNEYKNNRYPEKEVIEEADELLSEILENKNDNIALLKALTEKENQLLRNQEDSEDIEGFFNNQKTIFDNAAQQYKVLKEEKSYFFANEEMQKSISSIKEILNMPKPYDRIKDLPELVQKTRKAYSEILEGKRSNVAMNIQNAIAEINDEKETVNGSISTVDSRISFLEELKNRLPNKKTITEMDAAITQIDNMRQEAMNIIAQVRKSQTVKPDNHTEPQKPYIVPKRTKTVYRGQVCPKKTLNSKEDIDKYVDHIRNELVKALDGVDGLKVE
ncbi:MAG: hypothetical protein HUJ54_12115, partial [Erysipelotrichaceae bacterium]|nr:hypothetical protein [Erysipelotrichaceae bacterium]